MKKRKPAKKAPQPEPDIRTRLGLAGAEIGDLHGAEQFLAFIKRECLPLWLFSDLPELVKARFHVIHHEAEMALEFTSGYRAADIASRAKK